jgi:hypothetical protein
MLKITMKELIDAYPSERSEKKMSLDHTLNIFVQKLHSSVYLCLKYGLNEME